MILRRFESPVAAAHYLAEQIQGALQAGLSERGAASLVLAGGRTPVPLFHALRQATLDWSHVAVTLTDERWVPDTHPSSNAALVREELLTGPAASARFLPLFDGSAVAADAVASVWRSLEPIARPFDAVALGMGEDGHFASLFPGNEALDAALDVDAPPGCVAMRAPTEPRERISLNLAALLQARRVFLFVTGETKLQLVDEAAQPGAGRRYPVSALLAQREPQAEVCWAP